MIGMTIAPVPPRFELTYHLTQQDFASAISLHFSSDGPRWRGWLLVTGPSVAMFLWLVKQHGGLVIPTVAMTGGALFGAALYLLVTRWWLPRATFKLFAQERRLHGDITTGWDAKGLYVATITGSDHYPWNHFIRWRQNDKVIQFCRSDSEFEFIPKRVLSPEYAAALREVLTVAGVPKTGRS